MPKLVRLIDVPLLRRRDQIFRNLIIFLLVDQYPERQSFVEQALASFLTLMKLVPRDYTA